MSSLLEETWQAAVDDAALDVSSVRVYPIAGAPPGGQVADAWWWLPHTNMARTTSTPLSPDQVHDGNDPAHRGLHRISRFAGVTRAELAATLRHEREHVWQWAL